MPTFKKLASGAVQIRIVHRLLPKPFWATFDDEKQARDYASRLEGLLAQGVVPASLLQPAAPDRKAWLITRCIAEYQRANSVPLSDVKLLDTMRPQFGVLRTSDLNYDWAEAWIQAMRREQNLAPSTIRHRHGALARCLDWMTRKHPDILIQNPLRQLKRGFAVYTPEDKVYLAVQGKSTKIDEERNRRLDLDEEQRIERVLEPLPQELLFFHLALETAMRMRECYTLYQSQVDLAKRTINLDRSKNGDNRQVPLPTPIVTRLRDYLKVQKAEIALRDGRLFAYWDGNRDVTVLDEVTSDVSRIFRVLFMEADVIDFHFHDLRHEATCRLYERTGLSDVLIAKITGHRDLRMLKRYASLRGSDLAAHLW